MFDAAGKTDAFVRTMKDCITPDQVGNALVERFSKHGFDRLCLTYVPERGSGWDGSKKHLITTTMPQEWLEHYFSNNYPDVDMHVHALVGQPRTLWRDLRPRYDDTNMRIHHERSVFKMRDGAAWSLRAGGGAVMSATFAGERLDLSDQDLPVLDFAAAFAFGKIVQMLSQSQQIAGSPRYSKGGLSPREREALLWAAEGLRTDEIADKMGISDNGVEAHFRSIRRKLGTTTRVHSVAEALRRKLIV